MLSQEEYLKTGKCPFCGAHNCADYGDISMEGSSAFQKVYCTECEGEWCDVYTMTGYETN